jgi:hypothetical protein
MVKRFYRAALEHALSDADHARRLAQQTEGGLACMICRVGMTLAYRLGA